MQTPAHLAERDDELRRLLVEMEQLDAKRAALQDRVKLLLGLGGGKKVKSRFSQADIDAWAKAKR